MNADVCFWSPAPVFCFAEADQEQTEAEDMNADYMSSMHLCP